MSIRDWSVLPASNGNAAPGINWQENVMFVKDVNDSARAMMADVAKWLADTQGALTSTGSANNYIVTTSGGYGALVDGLALKIKFNISNTSASNLSVDSLGAKQILKYSATGAVPIAQGDIIAGLYYFLIYDSVANGWILSGLGAPKIPDASPGFRNKIINGNFAINQRGYSSETTTTGANQYTVDRWRVVTAGQALNWAASGVDRLVTAPTGGIEQVIEGRNIEGGTYVLSWTGTATATVNSVTVAKNGSFTLPANTNATVRFANGTVGLVQLEAGSTATLFERRPVGIELYLCQRYCYRQDSLCYFNGNSGNAAIARGYAKFAVTMMTEPTIVVYPGANLAGTQGQAYVSNTNGYVNVTSVQNITKDGFDSIVNLSNFPSSNYLYGVSYMAVAEF